ncbi:PKD domain-containing protein [Sanguibacter sp. A247]|uniref:PKD domain-containing protein n=1 Tax=unclassified Sanguibacter TaxID=2645534 RepID=UPI003FD7F37D
MRESPRASLPTAILGTVELEATPTTFAWDPGDGTDPFTSAQPGAPFPNDTVTHIYTKVGECRITLTTTASFETREIRSVLS